MTRQELEEIVAADIKKAREGGIKSGDIYRRPGESSFHDLCKTQEQADRFMRLLRLCETEAREEEAQAKAAAALQENQA